MNSAAWRGEEPGVEAARECRMGRESGELRVNVAAVCRRGMLAMLATGDSREKKRRLR
jgi:hypothetical protein